jgi:molecular chaperone DnaK (HSP70)
MDGVFGLDFGTTNTVASLVEWSGNGLPRVRSLTDMGNGRPHPSVVWYSAEGPVVGCQARDRMSELGLGVFGDTVRSPKMYLGGTTPICV